MPIDSNRKERPQQPLGQLHLLYHEISPDTAAYSYVTSTARFEQHVDLYAGLLANGSPRVPTVTFDDGHVSNFALAAPILALRNLTAHFFITVGWTGIRPGYMDWPQLRALLQAGHTIGAHGWSHTFLTHCTPPQLDIELNRARLVLEDRLGVSITTMSLPGGRANRRVLAACFAAGYRHVYTSAPRCERIPLGATVGRLNMRGDAEPGWLAQLFDPTNPLLARLGRKHRMKVAAQSILGDRLYLRIWALANRHEGEANLQSQIYPATNGSPQDPSA